MTFSLWPATSAATCGLGKDGVEKVMVTMVTRQRGTSISKARKNIIKNLVDKLADELVGKLLLVNFVCRLSFYVLVTIHQMTSFSSTGDSDNREFGTTLTDVKVEAFACLPSHPSPS